MGEVLAKITVDSKSRQIRDISLLQKHFRFKCKRCATLCCRLGGPKLSKKNVEGIEEAGYNTKDFLEPVDSESRNMSVVRGNLKNREDGACIFLRFEAKQNHFKCSIYDDRPILCRLYPFDFDKYSSNIVFLKFIPCCRGLNSPDGELVDEKWIKSNLVAPLFEA